jgi:hypothetical protein
MKTFSPNQLLLSQLFFLSLLTGTTGCQTNMQKADKMEEVGADL